MGRFSVVACALLVATSVHGSTVVLPTDPAAAIQQADVVAIGTVASVGALPAETVIELDVDEVKRGEAPSRMVLSELGGSEFVVHGAPRYEVGDRVLVLATKRDDGTFRTYLMDAGRIPLETPWWSLGMGALRAAPASVGSALDAWKAGVADAALALPSEEPEPALTVPAVRRRAMAVAPVRTMGAKWRRSDPIPVHAPTVPDSALGLAASDAAIVEGVRAWDRAGTTLRLEQQDERRAPVGFMPEPGRLLVSFDDPRAEIDDPRGCSGVLAIGGFSADGRAQSDGLQTIVGSALVFNNGWGGCGFWSQADYRNFAEVMAHEVGHTIGLAHSCGQGEACDAEARGALMYWSASFDGRGAALQPHDRRSVLELYGAVATPSPSPTETPGSTVTPTSGPTATATPGAEPEPVPTPRGCKQQTAGEALILFGVLAGVCVASRRRRTAERG